MAIYPCERGATVEAIGRDNGCLLRTQPTILYIKYQPTILYIKYPTHHTVYQISNDNHDDFVGVYNLVKGKPWQGDSSLTHSAQVEPPPIQLASSSSHWENSYSLLSWGKWVKQTKQMLNVLPTLNSCSPTITSEDEEACKHCGDLGIRRISSRAKNLIDSDTPNIACLSRNHIFCDLRAFKG